MRLHLGCGLDKRKGFVNCDVSSLVEPDKVVDLERGLPFEDDSVEEILANHVFEHVVNFVPLMHEIRRVCKRGAMIKIRVPFYAAWGWFNDPTHVRFFSPFSFDYFKRGTYSHEVGCDEDMFDVQRVRLNFGIGRAKKLNWIVNPV
ncbi:MAG: class I SAM-dependent methyltransferase, partial [Nanoarchaeota archaeon]|nr:class I SAM-dependent methyltransferase [Nanoarchaeota archaeon]